MGVLMKAVGVLLVFALFFSTQTFAKTFTTGFNQAWIFNRYGSQWVSGFDINEFRRTMRLTKQANGEILRFWLFEGYNSDNLIMAKYTYVGVKPEFLANLKLVLQAAKEEGVQLNLTLFDGNMGNYSAPNEDLKNIAWNLFNDRYQVRQDFLNNVFAPLLDVINLPQFRGVVTQLDLANEINALVRSASEVRFEQGWGQVNQFICQFYAIKQSKGSSFQMTASLGWGDAVENVMNGNVSPNCVDFYDVHVYDSDGEIDQCQAVAAHAHSLGKKIFLGEFGQSNFWKTISDSIQLKATRNFLNNAYNCKFDGAMGWRLVENEAESFLAYEKNGVLRPAYYEFQKLSAGYP